MLDAEQLVRAAERIAAAATRPATAIVFGSYASGDASEASDLDSVVIEPELPDRPGLTLRVARKTRTDQRNCVGMESTMRRCVVACVTALGVALASSSVCAQARDETYSTAEQRELLRATQQELCSRERVVSLGALSQEGADYVRALQRINGLREALELGNDALGLAQNRMGEGHASETYALLCAVLGSRERAIGIAAPRTVAVFNSFAVLLRKTGRTGDARRILQGLEPIVTLYPTDGASLTRAVLNNFGAALMTQGYYEQAEETFRRSLAIAAVRSDSTTAMTNIAKSFEARHKWAEAEALYRQVLDIRMNAADADINEVAAAWSNLGDNLTAQRRFAEAEVLIRQALQVRRMQGEGHLNVGYSLASLVVNLRGQGKSKAALPLAIQLVGLRRKALGEMHAETSAAHRLLAEVRLALGDTASALQSARQALSSASALADREADGLDDASREAVRHAPALAALTLVSVAWKTAGQTNTHSIQSVPPVVREAFLAGQRMTVSSTFESVLSAGARQAGAGRNQDLIDTYETLVGMRTQLDAQIASAAARGLPLEKLYQRQRDLDASRAAAAAKLRTSFPSYFDLIRPQPLPLTEAASLLKSTEALVLIVPGMAELRGYVWVVTKEKLTWTQLELGAGGVEEAVRQFRRTIDSGNFEGVNAEHTPVVARWDAGYMLYKGLFAASSVMQALGPKSSWILAPQGAAVSIPFNALPITFPPADLSLRPLPAHLRGIRWLGLERSLAIIPSVSAMTSMRKTSTPLVEGMDPFFGVGDPFFPESKLGRLFAARNRTASAGDLATLRQLDPLPGTRLEIEQLARILGADERSYILAKQATERELWERHKSGQLGKARVISFATHGLIGGELSESSPDPALVLTPPASASSEDDGLLTSSEIKRMKLRAEWVLLSACNTAAGRNQEAEGLTGLASAFLFAGAKSLLISHWRVADSVGPRISIRAIELTGRPGWLLGKAGAVRQAMQELMADTSKDEDQITTYAHPAAWASFAVVGLD